MVRAIEPILRQFDLEVMGSSSKDKLARYLTFQTIFRFGSTRPRNLIVGLVLICVRNDSA